MAHSEEVMDVLQKVGAFRSGHFVLTSGRHSDSYINKDAMYAYPQELSQLCRWMAERFEKDGIEAVTGPAVGAAILAQWTAFHLTEMAGHNVFATYADKDGQGGFILKRGYDQLVKGRKTLVVEDLTTTGGSIQKVVDAAREAGADVVGAIVVCNRGNVTAEQAGNPGRFESLVEVELESWEAGECELCKNNIPVNTDIGHGKDFLAKKKA